MDDRIEIMKGSCIGSYGVLGLMLALGLRAALLIDLPAALLLPGLVASAAFGRWVAVAAMVIMPTLNQPGSLAKDIGQRPGLAILSGATLLMLPFLAPLAAIVPGALMAGTGCAMLFLLWFRQSLMRHLGGVTGDCLGFAVYAGQLILLLGVAARWPAA